VPTPSPKEPEAPAVKKEPEPPVPVLAPQVDRHDEDQLRRDTAARIQQGERLAAQLEEKPLTEEQREQLLTIRTFLGKAKEAVVERDLARASNLAEKARILADELTQRVR
jgi:hypothetical protein